MKTLSNVNTKCQSPWQKCQDEAFWDKSVRYLSHIWWA